MAKFLSPRLSASSKASSACPVSKSRRLPCVYSVPPNAVVTDSLQAPLQPLPLAKAYTAYVPSTPIPAIPATPDEGPAQRIMRSKAVQMYMNALSRYPLSTKCWTSCSGFLLGDVAAQMLTEPHFMLSRTLILAAYGFFIDAPAGNAFYNWLDSNIEPSRPKTAIAVGKKILIDQLLYAPVFTCILYAYLQAANGDVGGIPEVFQDKVLPTLLANYAVWPLAHALNFYYVPTEQRILYNNFVAVCWTTWLSCLAH